MSLSLSERGGSILSGFVTAFFPGSHCNSNTHHKWSKTGRTFRGASSSFFCSAKSKAKSKQKKNGKKGNNSLGVIMIIQFTLAEREEIERNKKKVGENKLCGTHITEKISQAVFFFLEIL